MSIMSIKTNIEGNCHKCNGRWYYYKSDYQRVISRRLSMFILSVSINFLSTLIININMKYAVAVLGDIVLCSNLL